MDNNTRPKIIMNTDPLPSEPSNAPVVQPAAKAAPAPVNIQSDDPLAKGLPSSWSIEPPEMPIRRKGVK